MKRVQLRGSARSLPKAVSNEVVSAIKASALNSTPTDDFAAPGVHRLRKQQTALLFKDESDSPSNSFRPVAGTGLSIRDHTAYSHVGDPTNRRSQQPGEMSRPLIGAHLISRRNQQSGAVFHNAAKPVR